MGRHSVMKSSGPLGEQDVFVVGPGPSVQDRIYASATPKRVLDDPLVLVPNPPPRQGRSKRRK